MSNMSLIQSLFIQFLNNKTASEQIDNDLVYSLMQSTVEPTIRFKFGAWLAEHYNDRITLNLMETNRIDLVIGIDNQIYLIEFGHLLNLLQHGSDLNDKKVLSDEAKTAAKTEKLINKIKAIDDKFLIDKGISLVICSLFSDIKLEEHNNRIKTKTKIGILKAGTLFKYGESFKTEKIKPYFQAYQEHINRKNEDDKPYLTGYTEQIIIPNELSLHYKFKCVPIKLPL